MSAAELGPRAALDPDIEIVPVSGKADLDRFIRVPFALHADDPNWVPPLLMERHEALSPAKNPYFQHAEVQMWIARRGGRDVGRISAQVDRLSLEAHKDQTGHFGMLAAEDDPAVFAALLGTAEDWLRARGMRRVLGPFNLSINEEMGVLVEGFEKPPMLLMGHDRPYVSRRLEEQGYGKEKDVIAYLYDIAKELPPGPRAMLKRRLPEGVTLRTLSMKRYAEDIRALTEVFNDAWAGNWGFVPLTEAEIQHMANAMKPLIDERLVWFVEVEGEPAAFGVCLPNINEAIRDLDGRLLPFGWAKLLWRLKVKGVKTGRVPLMGVRRKFAGSHRGQLLPFLLIDAVDQAAKKQGYTHYELSWILEDNMPMRRICEASDAQIYKTYRLYSKALT